MCVCVGVGVRVCVTCTPIHSPPHLAIDHTISDIVMVNCGNDDGVILLVECCRQECYDGCHVLLVCDSSSL